MKRAKDKMAGQTGVGCDRCRLIITDFPNHNDIRRLPEHRSKGDGKGHPNLSVDLNLIDPDHLVFHRLFDGDDLAVWFVDVVQARIESTRLARTSRTSHEENAI